MKRFDQKEIDEIYEYAVNELECAYRDKPVCWQRLRYVLIDIDIANEPVEKFDIDSSRVPVIQSIIKKIGGDEI